MGVIALNNRDYPKAWEHYETALKSIPQDGVAHFRLALAYQFLTSDGSSVLVERIKTENEAKAARADQFQIDDLSSMRQRVEADLHTKRATAIEQLAVAL